MNIDEMVSTRHQFDKWVSEWQVTVFVVGETFRFFGPPLRAHFHFISFDHYHTYYLLVE